MRLRVLFIQGITPHPIAVVDRVSGLLSEAMAATMREVVCAALPNYDVLITNDDVQLPQAWAGVDNDGQ